MQMDEQLIKIRDLGLVTALISLGVVVKDTKKELNGRMYFIFEDTTQTRVYINDYWEDELKVKARNYSDSMKMLKTRIYSEERYANFKKQ